MSTTTPATTCLLKIERTTRTYLQTEIGGSWCWKWSLIVPTPKAGRLDSYFTTSWVYFSEASAKAAARRWAKTLGWKIVRQEKGVSLRRTGK